ncbi:MAG: tRNA (adenosine(37)-N6)-dimethylallyltransferase MiaA [Candidatus Portnoybacteria bacterium]
MKNNKLIVVLGPTASGKSSLAVRLAKEFNGEIVSADSRQIYKEMDIGTAKITKEEMEGVPHYLIDVVRPDQGFTLAQFKKKAIEIIKDIQKRGKLPFLVGGTGLYIQSVVDNLNIPEVKPNQKLREKLEKQTSEKLFNQLKKLDPESAKTIDGNNKRRIIRALEVCLLTKKPFSEQRKKGRPLFDTLQIGLSVEHKILERRIKQRAEKMVRDGLVKEVEKLAKKYDPGLPAMSGIGYQLPISKEAISLQTRQYARRQMTWFKRDKRIHWVKDYPEAKILVGKIL